MKTTAVWWSLVICLVFTSSLSAKDAPEWLAKVPPLKPGLFPAPEPIVLQYSGGWGGITAGKIRAEYSRTGNVETARLTGGTVGLAKVLYRLDTDSSARANIFTFLPIDSEIDETYSDENRHTTLRFSPEKMVLSRSTVPARKDAGKDKSITIPNLLDLHSSMLYLRSQPLKTGDEITFLTYATGSAYLAKVTVLPPETIFVPAGKFPAIHLRLDLQGIDKKLRLKPYTRAKNITAWISNDSNRYFLKFKADLTIGSVIVELDSSSLSSPVQKSTRPSR